MSPYLLKGNNTVIIDPAIQFVQAYTDEVQAGKGSGRVFDIMARVDGTTNYIPIKVKWSQVSRSSMYPGEITLSDMVDVLVVVGPAAPELNPPTGSAAAATLLPILIFVGIGAYFLMR
jgi:hypothetical protein